MRSFITGDALDASLTIGRWFGERDPHHGKIAALEP
jgi:hypothetical protein